MKTICAFCNAVIKEDASADGHVSHGVCKACYRRILTEYGFNLQKYLDLLNAPVFLVDSDANVLAANTLAIGSVKKPVEQIKGKLCGDVLECINAFLPEGCGKTAHCPDCTIRSSVDETYATGNQITRRPATVTLKKNGSQVTEHLLVSTRKEGNIILLRLEPGGVV